MLFAMWDYDDKAEKIRFNIYKNMTSIQKWQVLQDLRATAWTIKYAAIRQQHPDWTDKQVEEKVKEIFLYATT